MEGCSLVLSLVSLSALFADVKDNSQEGTVSALWLNIIVFPCKRIKDVLITVVVIHRHAKSPALSRRFPQ